MKKHTLAALLLCLALTLSACSSGKDAEPAAPEQTSIQIGVNIAEEPTAVPTAQPTPEPAPIAQVEEAPVSEAAPTELPSEDAERQLFDTDDDDDASLFDSDATSDTYDAPVNVAQENVGGMVSVTGTSFGFTVSYPSGWVNKPGRFTICYQEAPADGSVGARFAVTKKTLAHAPKTTRLQAQFASYGEFIKKQYDQETFEWEEEVETTFLGQKGLEITYLAYLGRTEIKGYMICGAVDKDMYIYHFYAPADRYDALRDLRLAIRDSIIVPTAGSWS